MAEKIKVIVDTDILIKAYRGDEIKIRNLSLLKSVYCISVITAIELIAGANTIKQLSAITKVLKVYTTADINDNISKQALKIYKQYAVKHT